MKRIINKVKMDKISSGASVMELVTAILAGFGAVILGYTLYIAWMF